LHIYVIISLQSNLVTQKTNGSAIITGAASGIGREFAFLLAKENYNLILIDIDEPELAKTSDAIRNSHDCSVETLCFDLSKYGVAEEIYRAVREREPAVLINNAGFGLYGPFSETSWEHEEKMIMLHVLNLTHLSKLVIKDMLKRKVGRILNISSVAGFFPGPMMSLYYSTKGYIVSFSRALSEELKGTGVTVTVLCPGVTRTGFSDRVTSLSASNKFNYSNFTSDAGRVALHGYKAMLAGKAVAVPGILNKILTEVPRVLPLRFVTSAIKLMQVKSRR